MAGGNSATSFIAAGRIQRRITDDRGRMISDFITWSLMIGQAILIGMCATGIGWDAFRATETPALAWGFVGAGLFAGGVIGTVGQMLVARYWIRSSSTNRDTESTAVVRRAPP
jgi:hypothetical protein